MLVRVSDGLAHVSGGKTVANKAMDADFWKERAGEARLIASSVDHAERVNLLIIAMGYERMAELAHERAAAKTNVPICSPKGPGQKAG
jgi:hypothetical protein